jgi:hypothetical protein
MNGDQDRNGNRPIGGLLRDLASDLTRLFRDEIALARAEIGTGVGQAANGAAMAVAGGLVASAGLVVLLLAAATLLAEWMEPWLASLIVALAAFLIGYLLVRRGMTNMQPSSLVPRKTAENVRRDIQTMKEQLQ